MTMSKSRNRRTASVLAIVCLTTALGLPATAQAAGSTARCTSGAPGIGDPYYPNYGNGGYQVRKYNLDVTYDPATDVLDGVAAIKASATKSLCRFNLDLVGMTVRSIKVNGARARWSRTEHELTVIPKHPIRRGDRFQVKVKYDGVPHEFEIPGFGARAGFMTTPDGATVAGQPEVAAGLVPGQRPPVGQGHVLLRRHGAEGIRGRRKRVPHRARNQARLDHLRTGTRANPWRPTSPQSTSVTGTSTSGAPRPSFPSMTRSTPQSPAGAAGRHRFVLGPAG